MFLMDEQLRVELKQEFKGVDKNGINDFIKCIKFEDSYLTRENIAITDDTDIIWYPGAGGDISPCTVLGIKEFEKKNNIEANDKKLYIFTDPVAYGFGRELLLLRYSH